MWEWYPGAWNDFADCSFSPAVGCGRGCEYCWARSIARRFKGGSYGPRKQQTVSNYCKHCSDCAEFKVHDHFERWEKFRARLGERVAFCYMGDLFDPLRDEATIMGHLITARMAFFKNRCKFLIQTRHVRRFVEIINHTQWITKWDSFEIGTTFAGPEDIENVRALGELPDDVVRFIAFEPCDHLFPTWYLPTLHGRKSAIDVMTVFNAIQDVKPNWAYIGPQTPGRFLETKMVRDIERLVHDLKGWGCKAIFKKSCGPKLYKRNKGVTLP